MLKIERIQNLLKCVICNNLLDKPIYLPCGEIVCQKHLDDMHLDLTETSSVKSIQCSLCNKKHVNNFYIVKFIQDLIKLHVDEIHCQSFTECKQTLSELETEIDESEEILSDSKNYIEKYFEKIKTEVILHQSIIKTNIDVYCAKLLEKIDKTKKDCESTSENFQQRSTKIKETKQKLKALLDEFDSPGIEDARYEALNSKAKKLKPRLNEDLNYNLLSGSFYKFEPVEKKIEDLFGKFVIFKVNLKNL